MPPRAFGRVHLVLRALYILLACTVAYFDKSLLDLARVVGWVAASSMCTAAISARRAASVGRVKNSERHLLALVPTVQKHLSSHL